MPDNWLSPSAPKCDKSESLMLLSTLTGSLPIANHRLKVIGIGTAGQLLLSIFWTKIITSADNRKSPLNKGYGSFKSLCGC